MFILTKYKIVKWIKCYAPFKVIVFSWQLLFGWLPTKENIYKRGVFSEVQQPDCRWCPSIAESEGHLFGTCPFASGLWYKIFKCLGFSSMVHPDPFVSMGTFCFMAERGKGLKGLLTVWHAMMWNIWRARNDFIFSSKVPILEECFDNIKRNSWRWLMGKKKGGTCLLYEWNTNPIDCIFR
jgi:hypothetical protein